MNARDELAEMKKRMDELEKRVLAEDAQQPHSLPVDVTVCICVFWGEETLPPVLKRLFEQGVRMNVLLALDETSRGPTRDMLTGGDTKWWMEHHMTHSVGMVTYIGEIPHRQSVADTSALAKAAFIDKVTTEFVFWLDADVLIDPDSIRTMIAEMRAKPEVGALCIPYTMVNDHNEIGACLMRTEIAKKIGFDGRPDKANGTRCECMNVARDLGKIGLKMVATEATGAYHLKKWR